MIVTPPRYFGDGDCGYCKDSKKQDHYALESQMGSNLPRQSVTIGSSIWQMSCKEYDELINTGFRRSGTFLYKTDLLRSCCRLYTIRTKLEMCKLTKEHRKVVNRFIKEICPELPQPKKNTFDLNRLYEAQLQSKRFKTRFEPSKFSKEKFELYKKYQVSVHNDDPDDVTESSFKRFLCDTPFPDDEVDGDKDQFEGLELKNWGESTKPRIGPTHELYFLDGKLIAISILDFLPSGVSSIYFIWDPGYAHLSLGTLSGLKEMQMCDKLNYSWYYLGYYIEDCVKMKYKSKFGGELLDLCNEVYFPLEIVDPYIKNGRLFVIGEKDDEYDSELEIESLGAPLDYKDSDFYEKKLVNIAEDIYGDEKVEADAKKAKQILKVKYQIDSKDSQKRLPNVVPGMIPLWQILEWFDMGTIDEEFVVEIFMGEKMFEYSLDELNGEGRAIVVDCIRAFGLEKVQDMVITL
ncbi:arginine-tRNA-protein transferase [Candida albicans P78048]|uniref:arginyltransferase n=2 Tax=Candida albicans TaxID=5476 RepID=A0A1D8PG12_CANAL|nr:arginyltransferase [Candida albicans SC5314]AOW27077.1 arginyltransferase [Candida albicans SC5314]KGR15892.1 arginine-tRNA-protein transferase [Candida albicans P78048]KHC59160.1 arginine-tRNA-protein transferase [Candida albicans P37039]|eukprot:XP_719556.2 arginyltransferase [Candida albicans SC5314]